MQEAEKLKKINKEIPTSKFQKGEINLALRLSCLCMICAECSVRNIPMKIIRKVRIILSINQP